MNEHNELNSAEEINNTEETKPAKKSSFLKDLIKDIIIAVVIVLAITAVIKPTIVKEDSMLDTLQSNNYLELINDQDGSKKLLIKRVIGVEGDVISFEDDCVYRNGKLLDEDYIYDEEPAFRNYPNGKEFVVGEDEIFAMGDHRSVSWDSRSDDVGMVSEDKVVGKAFLRLFPFNEIGLL